MEIGLNLLACYENGIVFTREVLAVDTSAYISDIQKAFMDALTLSIEIFYPTKENIEILIKKAFMDAKTLGVNAEIFDKGVIEELLKKAGREVQVLGEKIKI
jgi:large subunit ribosomal protein L10